MRYLALLLMGGIGWAGAAWAEAPQDAVDRKQIIQLLKADRFTELEALFSGLQDGYEQGTVSELAVAAAFAAFADSDPDLQAHLQQWSRQFPGSFAAYQAMGDYQQGLAWKVRGSGWAKDTSEARMAGMAVYLKAAYQAYVHAIELRPKLIPTYVALIRIGNGFGQEVLEQGAMEQGLQVDPASYLIHYQYLFSMQPKWGGSYAAIEAHLTRVRPYYAGHPLLKTLEGFPHYVRANELRLNRRAGADLAAAEVEIEAALEAGPNPMYLWERGNIYRAQGHCRKAVADFAAALQQLPREPGLLRDRGWCYYHMNDVDHALQDYNEAIELDALAADTRRYRGILHYAQKRVAKAKRDLEASLVYGDRNVTAHQYLAYIYYNEKDFPKAERHFGKAVSLGDRQSQDRYLLAFSQWKNENCAFVDTARAYLQLCGDQGDCKQADMRWAKESSAYAVRKGICH